jgi:hypothetical protein
MTRRRIQSSAAIRKTCVFLVRPPQVPVRTRRNSFILGTSLVSILIGGFGSSGEAASTVSAQTGTKIVVRVSNYAQVDQKILERADQIASRIFRDAGVQAIVVSINPRLEQPTAVDREVPQLCRLVVDILPREMAERLQVPADYMGFAPGSPAVRNRTKVFVFDHMVEKLAREQLTLVLGGKISSVADKAQILGHVIAHEIGHLLLDSVSHSRKGIMQANWNRAAMRDMAVGRLKFNLEEIEQIQAEVSRRSVQPTASPWDH